MRNRTGLLVGVISICSYAMFARPVSDIPSALHRPLSRFDVRGKTAIEAILRFGWESKIPLGVVIVDDRLCKTKVDINVQNQSAGEVLDRLISEVGGYSRTSADGVVVIAPQVLPAGARKFLNLKISHFTVPEGELQKQLALLGFSVWTELRPGEGVAGSIMGSPAGHNLPPIDVRDLTLQQILNVLVSRGAGGQWLLFPVPDDLRNVAGHQFARAFSYADAPNNISSVACTPTQ